MVVVVVVFILNIVGLQLTAVLSRTTRYCHSREFIDSVVERRVRIQLEEMDSPRKKKHVTIIGRSFRLSHATLPLVLFCRHQRYSRMTVYLNEILECCELDFALKKQVWRDQQHRQQVNSARNQRVMMAEDYYELSLKAEKAVELRKKGMTAKAMTFITASAHVLSCDTTPFTTANERKQSQRKTDQANSLRRTMNVPINNLEMIAV